MRPDEPIGDPGEERLPALAQDFAREVRVVPAALGQMAPADALKTANTNLKAIITKAGYTLPA